MNQSPNEIQAHTSTGSGSRGTRQLTHTDERQAKYQMRQHIICLSEVGEPRVLPTSDHMGSGQHDPNHLTVQTSVRLSQTGRRISYHIKLSVLPVTAPRRVHIVTMYTSAVCVDTNKPGVRRTRATKNTPHYQPCEAEALPWLQKLRRPRRTDPGRKARVTHAGWGGKAPRGDEWRFAVAPTQPVPRPAVRLCLVGGTGEVRRVRSGLPVGTVSRGRCGRPRGKGWSRGRPGSALHQNTLEQEKLASVNTIEPGHGHVQLSTYLR